MMGLIHTIDSPHVWDPIPYVLNPHSRDKLTTTSLPILSYSRDKDTSFGS